MDSISSMLRQFFGRSYTFNDGGLSVLPPGEVGSVKPVLEAARPSSVEVDLDLMMTAALRLRQSSLSSDWDLDTSRDSHEWLAQEVEKAATELLKVRSVWWKRVLLRLMGIEIQSYWSETVS